MQFDFNKKNICVLGFDHGAKRIGVAVGQSISNTAKPLKTLMAKKGNPDWHIINKYIEEWGPNCLVVGMPTSIQGEVQHSTRAAQNFVADLQQKFNLPVHTVDERLTTKAAREIVFEHGGYGALEKAEIDGVAACLIVEQFLREKI